MKWLIMVLLCLLMCSLPVQCEENDLTPSAASSVLMDYDSGEVLYEKNMHEVLYPASMTKMMSLYLVLEAIHQGAFDWDDQVVASKHAASMGGSQIYLEEGEVMSVLDLFKASTVASANDAITALAEKVSGTESEFVRMMNETAASFGCLNTHFVNPTGLHDDVHVSTAYDMALIAKHLLDEGKDEVLQYTSMMEDYIREDTDTRFWLVNTNKMLRSYPGMDGLKTGFTSQSQYCITVTAQRDGLRLIAVVMKEPDKNSRTKDASALLDYGFAQYDRQVFLDEHQYTEQIIIDKGIPEKISITNLLPVSVTVRRGEQVSEVARQIILSKTSAPIEKDDLVGTLYIELNTGKVLTAPLIASESAVRMNFLSIFTLSIRKLVF